MHDARVARRSARRSSGSGLRCVALDRFAAVDPHRVSRATWLTPAPLSTRLRFLDEPPGRHDALTRRAMRVEILPAWHGKRITGLPVPAFGRAREVLNPDAGDFLTVRVQDRPLDPVVDAPDRAPEPLSRMTLLSALCLLSGTALAGIAPRRSVQQARLESAGGGLIVLGLVIIGAGLPLFR